MQLSVERLRYKVVVLLYLSGLNVVEVNLSLFLHCQNWTILVEESTRCHVNVCEVALSLRALSSFLLFIIFEKIVILLTSHVKLALPPNFFKLGNFSFRHFVINLL